MSQQYRVGKLGKQFVLTFTGRDGKRRRYRLAAKDAGEAHRIAPSAYAELTRQQGKRVVDLWDAFVVDRAGRAITQNMPFTWKALAPQFAQMPGDAITVEDCRNYAADRAAKGIKPGTVCTELGRLRMVLHWAEKRGMLPKAPHIERPSPPKRRDLHLTREQCRALIDGAHMPHVRLFIILALATGGRNAALCELTWDRCDFERGLIDLRNPSVGRPHKGRAIIPMNRSARAALLEAKAGALSNYVIEWAGRPVRSVKKGLKAAAKAAGIDAIVSPHILRHSAAVHLAEAGIPMSEISQYLGHSNPLVTERLYARYSPTHLRKPAAVLEYDDFAEQKRAKNETN